MVLIVVMQTQVIKVGADEFKPQIKKSEKAEVKLTVQKETVKPKTVDEDIYYAIPIEDYEIDEMARVMMNEASILPYDGKVLVGIVIIDRVLSDKYPNTVHDVLFQENQFSHSDNNGEVTDEVYDALFTALKTAKNCVPDLYWFRTDYPHSFGHEYAHIGNTYFSTEKDYNNEID